MRKIILISAVFIAAIPRIAIAQKIMNDVEVQTTKDLYTIHAKLVDKRTGAAAGNKTGYVSVPGRVFEFRTSVSDSAGNIVFLVKNLESSKQLVFQVNNVTDSNLVFELNDPVAEKFNTEKFPKRIKEVGDTLPFYGKSDKDYLLDDYVRFPTMEEVLREFVASVRVRKQKNKFRIEVLNVPYNVFFDTEPLILLDGVPVFDSDILMAIDPLKIRNIQVVARKYYFGSKVLNGIVSFTSYDGDLAGYQLPPQAQVRDVRINTSVK
jgi:hypothetical protein